EVLAAVERPLRRRDARAAGGDHELLSLRSVAMEDHGLDADGRVARLQHDGAGSIAEEHARGAVFPVQEARERLSSDPDRVLDRAGDDHTARDRERGYEARACG